MPESHETIIYLISLPVSAALLSALKAVPCPIAREVGTLLNLSPGTRRGRATGRGVKSRHLGNRWLHDVLDIAESLRAERVSIVLDEQVKQGG